MTDNNMQPASTISAKSRHRSGVTLLELLLVIVVMAIIMSISIPAFTSIGRGAGMRGAVASLTSTISLSRQWAITKRERVVFQYGNTVTNDNDVGYYVVYAITDESAESAGEYPNSRQTIQSNRLDNAFSFRGLPGNPTEITFKTDGGASQSLPQHINISDLDIHGQNLSRKVKVNFLTGSVSVQQP
ncbi:MAG: GspH/FimT family pseudopilin [Kiritimatiellia bacterium]|nr:prepilin-type N-terminal cleavage/methylation domain-containing protein [Lentisphaerota bacterium]